MSLAANLLCWVHRPRRQRELKKNQSIQKLLYPEHLAKAPRRVQAPNALRHSIEMLKLVSWLCVRKISLVARPCENLDHSLSADDSIGLKLPVFLSTVALVSRLQEALTRYWRLMVLPQDGADWQELQKGAVDTPISQEKYRVWSTSRRQLHGLGSIHVKATHQLEQCTADQSSLSTQPQPGQGRSEGSGNSFRPRRSQRCRYCS
mmetsp:Transcript_110231/g.318604  ORF Transcript_110231/g.318604 Transcript_110231/m.318604 type:complete len:205 (-) Transcript_110231:1589-2203(-)